ncbi:MAG: hypothetical protein ITG02_13230 [Patulibacter sp.]|nr:hypothetical protein [Patulibacter sp.]
MVQTIRRRGTGVAVVALALGAVMGAPVAAQADALEFVPEDVWVKALDVAGDDVTQAGAHPDRLEIKFGVNTYEVPGARPGTTSREPMELVRDIEITLPEGIQGNPEALPKCPMTTFNREGCPSATVVGRHDLFYKGTRDVGTESTTLFNLEPPEGVVARFGMKVLPVPVVLDMKVKSDGSYAIVTRISNVSQVLHLISSTTTIYGVPARSNGSTSPHRPLLTLGSQCGEALPAKIRVNSWANPARWIETSPTMLPLTGCERLQFAPTMDVRPTSSVADAPSGYRVKLDVPQSQAPDSTATPPLKRAEILFPVGTAISPGGANGLWGCTDQQAATGVDATPDCPEVSRIGSVNIDTPVIDVPLKGGVFLGMPKSQDSQSGEMFRIFLQASAKGVDIKQEGKIYPDPVTGRLKAVFENAPQQPFETMTVELDGGPGAALVNPATCGTHTTTATMESWAGQTTTSSSSFQIGCRPGQGGFMPAFTAGAVSPIAGASSPFALSIGKPDGQVPLSGVAMKLPKGLLANLKGNLGKPVGAVTAFAGSGATPYQLSGTVYLEGPYGGAPFSLKVVVPAKAGPFNLGDVVVRQELFVDPHDASVTVHSDPIPTILQGVPTRIQRLDVNINKPGFMVNPTNCEPMAIEGILASALGQVAPINQRFQVGGCADLDYSPRLDMALAGPASELKNGGHPQLNATLKPKDGQANQKTAQVTLPLNLALDPDNAKALCEPAQAARNQCPADSIVGAASAVSILDVPLSGPVYFVRGERKTSTGRTVGTLPKLFVPLSGQGVTIFVHADSDVVDNKLQTTFENLPDAPISRFDLKINGGENGILAVTNGDVCKTTRTPKVGQLMTGQNGRINRSASILDVDCPTAIVAAEPSGSDVKVTIGGLDEHRKRITVSGNGVVKESRTISGRNTVATITPRLSGANRRALDAGRSMRIKLTVLVEPTAKDSKVKDKKITKTVTLETTDDE